MKVVLMTVAILLPLAASTNVMGGETHIHVKLNNPKVIFAARAINNYLRDNNPKGYHQHAAVEVMEATKQVVAGTMYTFKIKMNGKPNNHICTIRVWERGWMNPKLKTVHIKCDGVNQLVGAPVPAKFDNTLVQEALKSVTDRANMESNSANRLIPSGNGIVTTQVVNGIMFRFSNVEMEVTTCKNGDKKYTIKQCPPIQDQDADMRHVSAEVFWNFKSFELEKFSFGLSSSSSNNNAHSIMV